MSGLFSFGLGLLGFLFQSPPHILGLPFLTGRPAPAPAPPPPPPIITTVAATAPQNWETAIKVLESGLERLDNFGALAKSLLEGGKANLAATATEMALKILFGDVYFHAGGLSAIEIEFAKEVSAFERRSFQGRHVPGIDGFLHDGKSPAINPRPIQLQENSRGEVLRMRDDALDHEHAAEKAGRKNLALYIKYTGGDVNVDDVLRFLWEDGPGLGLSGITNRGIISEITIFTQGGVVRIDAGRMTFMMRPKKR